MADYIYLLENRLSHAQQKAIGALRAIARNLDATLFLTGGAVRDLTAGASVRDLDLTVQGDVSRAKKEIAAAGFELVGENSSAHQLFLAFPGGVRVELSSAVTVTYPKPGKPKYEPGNIIDDLRGRDFTANAMAISLNEGSYGLLMDPLNGVADIENRELRLVSNYGFIEDPSRLIRAVRLMARLGWQMEDKTRQRYDTAKDEGYISAMSPWSRGYELEEIFHEEDPVRVLRALENEGWMQHLDSALQSSKVNMAALAELYDKQGQLQIQGILGQIAAIAFPLLTAKLSSGDLATLKKLIARQGFVREIDSLDQRVKDFAAKFTSKDAAAPSDAWKMLHASEPNLVLAMAFGSKGAAVQSRLKTFLTESPTARQKIPYQLMTEMRITPDLPEYNELLDRLFFALMDGKLATPEELKAFLEPYSPPAPPPPPNLRRARARKEPKGGRGKKKIVEVEEAENGMPLTVAAEEELAGLESGLTKIGDLTGPDRGPEPSEHKPIQSVAPKPEKTVKKPAVTKKADGKVVKAEGKTKEPSAAKPAKVAPVKVASVAEKSAKAKGMAAPTKSAAPVKPATVARPVAAKVVSKSAAKPVAKPAAPVKKAAAPAKKAVTPAKVAPAKKTAVPVKKVATPAKKVVAKPIKPAAKPAVAKKAVVKAAPAKKVAPVKKAAPKPIVKKVAATKPVKSTVPARPAARKVVAKPAVPAKKVVSAKKAAPAKKAAAKKSGRR